MTRTLRSLLAVLALATLALGHDLWLLPPEAPVAAGQPAALLIAVGMDFPHSSHAIDPERVSAAAHGPDGQRLPASVLRQGDAETGATHVGFTPATDGTWVVALETGPRQLDLEAQAFNAYLLEDGMPQVLAERLRRGEGERPARERYRKFAKAVFRAGPPTDAGSDAGAGAHADAGNDASAAAGAAATQPVGARLEIVPARDPAGVRAGETLSAQVLFDGAPLVGSYLCWDQPGNGEDFTGMALTDADGRALVPIGSPGLQTLRLVHMTRPQTDDFEWESFWTSLTFVVP